MWSAAANSWATFISLDYRERLELVLKDLASRFGVEDSRGTLLITDLLHAKLAEMIGSSRPMITRLINEMVEQGVLARHGKQYVLLNRPQSQSIDASIRNQNAASAGPRLSNSHLATLKPGLEPKQAAIRATPEGRPSDRNVLSTAAAPWRPSALKS